MREIMLTIESVQEGETCSGIEYDSVSFFTEPELDAADLERGLLKHFDGDLVNFSYASEKGEGEFMLLCRRIAVGELHISYEGRQYHSDETTRLVSTTASVNEVHDE